MTTIRLSRMRTVLEASVAELPAGRRDHVLRVVAEAGRLANRHSIDEEGAAVAALGHDLTRGQPPAELLRQAEATGLEISDLERSAPILLHGPVSASLARVPPDLRRNLRQSMAEKQARGFIHLLVLAVPDLNIRRIVQ